MTSLRRRQVVRCALGALPLCVTFVLAGGAAHAQTASPEDVAAARSLGTEGTRLAEAGDCNGAIPKLEAAEKLYHAPTTLDPLGECEIAVGRLVAGTEDLNRVVRESLAANAPAAFVAAKKRAQQALAAAQPRIGNLKIHVDGAPADKVTLTVDGVPVSSALLDSDRPTDPGAHAVNATAPGFKVASDNVTVREGTESTLSLKLEVDPAVAASAAPPPAGATTLAASTAPAAASTDGSGAPSRGPAIAAFAVGGVGLVVGTVFGVLALGSKSTLDSECVNKTCASSAQSDIDSLSSKATVSTIGFGVGIAGVAVGAILLAVQHGGEKPAAAAQAPRPHWSPWIGAGTAGVGGTFQ